MSKELDELTSLLIEKSGEYSATVAALQADSPELFQRITVLRGELDDLESAVKSLLKIEEKSFENNQVTFRVSSRTTSKLDLETVVFKASQYEHIELLLEDGMLRFEGDADKIQRLPDNIRPLYEKHIVNSISKRVTMPKALKRKW